MIEAPVPTDAPPHDPEYQFQLAPDPKDPPTTVNVVGSPQVVLGLAVADVGSTDGVLIVTVTDTQAVVPQPVPVALTK